MFTKISWSMGVVLALGLMFFTVPASGVEQIVWDDQQNWCANWHSWNAYDSDCCDPGYYNCGVLPYGSSTTRINFHRMWQTETTFDIPWRGEYQVMVQLYSTGGSLMPIDFYVDGNLLGHYTTGGHHDEFLLLGAGQHTAKIVTRYPTYPNGSLALDYFGIQSVDGPPVADAGGNVAGYAGETVTLDGSYSYGGSLLTYEWTDELDEVVGTDATLDVRIDYGYAATYTLTVTDDLDETDEDDAVVSDSLDDIIALLASKTYVDRKVNIEASARVSADRAEGRARLAGDSAERHDRIENDRTLAGLIDEEADTRIENDRVLAGLIDDVDTALQELIDLLPPGILNPNASRGK